MTELEEAREALAAIRDTNLDDVPQAIARVFLEGGDWRAAADYAPMPSRVIGDPIWEGDE